MIIPNTLAVDAKAVLGCCATNVDEVKFAISRAKEEGMTFVALGAGSNIIPAAHVDKFVCLMRMQGIEVVSETTTDVVLRIAAGENWHELVLYTIAHGWFGLENLSLIPGLVGAAPVQNIGAYGVELARFVESVEVLDERGQQIVLGTEECSFEYRDSVFKKNNTLTIVAVSLRLTKQAQPVVDYPDLHAELDANEVLDPTPAEVSQAIIAIRLRKLPDPAVVPSASKIRISKSLVVEEPSVDVAFTVTVALLSVNRPES